MDLIRTNKNYVLSNTQTYDVYVQWVCIFHTPIPSLTTFDILSFTHNCILHMYTYFKNYGAACKTCFSRHSQML